MACGRRLYRLAAILFATAGIMAGALSSPASAATGADGFTILYASSGDQAHKCNVIGDDGQYQAVICSDLVTAENSTQYDVYGRAEGYCQTASTPHTVVQCDRVSLETELATGTGVHTQDYEAQCDGNCPSGRFYVSTPTWVYNIAPAEGGACSSNAGSAYLQWDVVDSSNDLSYIETPDGYLYYLDSYNANDGANESTGHYFICP
jgi:hypothetical protein